VFHGFIEEQEDFCWSHCACPWEAVSGIFKNPISFIKWPLFALLLEYDSNIACCDFNIAISEFRGATLLHDATLLRMAIE
jgi:hypothetical protein